MKQKETKTKASESEKTFDTRTFYVEKLCKSSSNLQIGTMNWTWLECLWVYKSFQAKNTEFVCAVNTRKVYSASKQRTLLVVGVAKAANLFRWEKLRSFLDHKLPFAGVHCPESTKNVITIRVTSEMHFIIDGHS